MVFGCVVSGINFVDVIECGELFVNFFKIVYVWIELDGLNVVKVLLFVILLIVLVVFMKLVVIDGLMLIVLILFGN